MYEARIDHSELTRLAERFAQAPQVLKEAKRQAFEAAAPKLKAVVDREIGGTGKVKSWQEAHVGSKGFYAAVRPKANIWAKATKKERHVYAVGYVTNAINTGHLSPRARKPIAGRHFYQHAQIQAEQVVQEVAEQISQTLITHLEG